MVFVEKYKFPTDSDEELEESSILTRGDPSQNPGNWIMVSIIASWVRITLLPQRSTPPQFRRTPALMV